MGLFNSIMNKIFRHPNAQAAPQSNPPQAAGGQGSAQASARPAPAPAQPAAAQPAAPAPQVDVEAVLATMAQDKGGGGNWRTSIVDLLKLLDLDSSLAARKELGQELNVHVGADGSAEQNIALHRAVMEKLAQNGGVVPDSLLRHVA